MMTPDEFTTPAPDNASFSRDQSCEQGNEGRRLADPSSTRGALLPVPATSRWAEQWPRRADEPRHEAQDSVISAQWIELPSSPSPRLLITSVTPLDGNGPVLQELEDVEEAADEGRRLADFDLLSRPVAPAPSSGHQQRRGRKPPQQADEQRRGSGNKPRHRSSDEDRQRRGGSGNKPPRSNGKVRGRGQQAAPQRQQQAAPQRQQQAAPQRQQQAAPQRQQQAVNQALWPADPFSMPTAPWPAVPTSGWQGKQTWRDDEQQREMRERRAALRRQEADLQSHLQRLEAQESAIAAQWAALPSSPSPLKRLLIALVVVSGVVVLFHWFPLLLVLVIVVGLAMAKAAHRSAQYSRHHTVWLQQERERLESRRRGIIAEQAVIRQHLTALQSELHQPLP
jgi:hypothetical protein